VGLLIQTSVCHWKSPLVDSIDHGDFHMDFVSKRTPRLKPGVYGIKEKPPLGSDGFEL
jgi:hypothetical protein